MQMHFLVYFKFGFRTVKMKFVLATVILVLCLAQDEAFVENSNKSGENSVIMDYKKINSNETFVDKIYKNIMSLFLDDFGAETHLSPFEKLNLIVDDPQKRKIYENEDEMKVLKRIKRQEPPTAGKINENSAQYIPGLS